MGTSLELKVINNDFSPSTFIKNVKSLTRESFAFFIAGQNPSSVFQEFESSDCPCICIDYHSDRYNLDYVYINNYQSAYKLTNYLISHGYKKLCFLVNINFAGTNMDKYFGFRKSLMKNGIEFTEDMHINADFAYIDLFKTMSIPEMPDALIFDSDQAAYNFMIYMMSKGYHIPENVSVASFDNTPLSKDIGLTSIGCKTMEIIEAAYELMLRRFSLPSATGQTVTLFPKIQERNTIKIK
jgi:DNA-binding LacI/PurR family transcriptional regulator